MFGERRSMEIDGLYANQCKMCNRQPGGVARAKASFVTAATDPSSVIAKEHP